jgi:hypothetical protein
MNLGDEVIFKVNGETLTGTIVNIYVVPKDYNLVDINVDGTIYKGIETNTLTLVEE